MLSRVWKESAPGPFVDPFNDFTSWNDGRFLAERGTPDRFAYPPNTSTQLSRDSSSLVSTKKRIQRFPYFPFFVLQNSCDPFEKNTRREIIDDFEEKERRDDWIVETWRESDFSKTKNSWPDLRKKSRTNQFSPESILREFRGNDKNCMERPLSVQTGEEKKQRRRRRKRRRKWKKERRKDNRYLNGKYNFFNECFNCSWIFIFTSVLWTFNKAVFTRREVWRSGDGEERREEVKIFPYGRLLLDFKAKRILAKFEAKGTKKERNMNIYK